MPVSTVTVIVTVAIVVVVTSVVTVTVARLVGSSSVLCLMTETVVELATAREDRTAKPTMICQHQFHPNP